MSWKRLATTYCSDTAVKKWARANAGMAMAGEGLGVGHTLLLTGTIVWCWKCGANGCIRPVNLRQPCTGRLEKFQGQARQRLLMGLHPHTRVPLGVPTLPEPGTVLPHGFDHAAREAQRSATSVSSAPLDPGWGSAGRLVVNPRLRALQERVRARLVPTYSPSLPVLEAPSLSARRRLRGKQSPPPAYLPSVLRAVPEGML